MSEQDNNTPAVSLDTDISGLNTGYKTLGEMQNAINSLREANRNPTAPETYNHANIEKEFGEVVTASRDSAAHEAEVKFCRENNYTQAQFDAHMRAFYGQGQAIFQATQEQVQARDDALIKHYGNAENAQVVWNRVKQLGVDPNKLSAEEIQAAHTKWEGFNPNEAKIGSPNQGEQPGEKGQQQTQIREDLTIRDVDNVWTMDPVNDPDSVDRFATATIKYGKREIALAKKYPQAKAMLEKAIAERSAAKFAKIQEATAKGLLQEN